LLSGPNSDGAGRSRGAGKAQGRRQGWARTTAAGDGSRGEDTAAASGERAERRPWCRLGWRRPGRRRNEAEAAAFVVVAVEITSGSEEIRKGRWRRTWAGGRCGV